MSFREYAEPTLSHGCCEHLQRRLRFSTTSACYAGSQRTTVYRPYPCERVAPMPCCSPVSQIIAPGDVEEVVAAQLGEGTARSVSDGVRGVEERAQRAGIPLGVLCCSVAERG